MYQGQVPEEPAYRARSGRHGCDFCYFGYCPKLGNSLSRAAVASVTQPLLFLLLGRQ